MKLSQEIIVKLFWAYWKRITAQVELVDFVWSSASKALFLVCFPRIDTTAFRALHIHRFLIGTPSKSRFANCNPNSQIYTSTILTDSSPSPKTLTKHTLSHTQTHTFFL